MVRDRWVTKVSEDQTFFSSELSAELLFLLNILGATVGTNFAGCLSQHAKWAISSVGQPFGSGQMGFSYFVESKMILLRLQTIIF